MWQLYEAERARQQLRQTTKTAAEKDGLDEKYGEHLALHHQFCSIFPLFTAANQQPDNKSMMNLSHLKQFTHLRDKAKIKALKSRVKVVYCLKRGFVRKRVRRF
jgi:hypothetical protein